jgi:hypothetical protein
LGTDKIIDTITFRGRQVCYETPSPKLVRRTNSKSVDHYLDDFIFMGSANTGDCAMLMSSFDKLCMELVVPLAKNKTILNLSKKLKPYRYVFLNFCV